MEKGLASSETGRRQQRVAELQKSNFEGPQLQFRNFFSPQFRNQFGCPQYCGIAEVRTKIADAHLWHRHKYRHIVSGRAAAAAC